MSKRKTVTVWVKLEIETRPGAEDALEAVDTVLDGGALQDEINGIDVGLKVTSATIERPRCAVCEGVSEGNTCCPPKGTTDESR